ncbi:Putative regulatory protein, FmdB, Zinc ribbon domain [Acidimicrobiia bacterium]
MPIYEYRCKDCGHEFETTQAFTDEPLTECPSCKGALKKKFGSVGISFKGSGFYKNDSRGTTSTTTPATSTDSGSSAAASTAATPASSGDSAAKPAAPAPAPTPAKSTPAS